MHKIVCVYERKHMRVDGSVLDKNTRLRTLTNTCGRGLKIDAI